LEVFEECLLVILSKYFVHGGNANIFFYVSGGTRYYEKVYRPQNFDIGNFSIDTAEAAP
jgi:hypothetical protein